MVHKDAISDRQDSKMLLEPSPSVPVFTIL